MAERDFVRGIVVRCGVATRDVEDVVQEVMLGAFVAIREGRYTPKPGATALHALRVWLTGIAWHQMGHYFAKAYRRREIPQWDPLGRTGDPGFNLEPTLAARALLRELRWLPLHLRVVLLLAAEEHTAQEIAAALGVPLHTVHNRLRAARLRFRRAIQR